MPVATTNPVNSYSISCISHTASPKIQTEDLSNISNILNIIIMNIADIKNNAGALPGNVFNNEEKKLAITILNKIMDTNINSEDKSYSFDITLTHEYLGSPYDNYYTLTFKDKNIMITPKITGVHTSKPEVSTISLDINVSQLRKKLYRAVNDKTTISGREIIADTISIATGAATGTIFCLAGAPYIPTILTSCFVSGLSSPLLGTLDCTQTLAKQLFPQKRFEDTSETTQITAQKIQRE